MTALSLERLRQEGDTFNTEISREYYLALSGNKASAELQPIYARHAEIMSRDALELAIEAFRGAPEGSEARCFAVGYRAYLDSCGARTRESMGGLRPIFQSRFDLRPDG